MTKQTLLNFVAPRRSRRELETWPQHMRDRVLGPEFEIRPLREKEQGKP